jgi:hypothetical protein
VELFTHEEVIGIWIGAADSKQLHQIMELAMNVAADSHRAFLAIDKVSRRVAE